MYRVKARYGKAVIYNITDSDIREIDGRGKCAVVQVILRIGFSSDNLKMVGIQFVYNLSFPDDGDLMEFEGLVCRVVIGCDIRCRLYTRILEYFIDPPVVIFLFRNMCLLIKHENSIPLGNLFEIDVGICFIRLLFYPMWFFGSVYLGKQMKNKEKCKGTG